MAGKQENQWQPKPGQWLVFRTDTQVQNDPVDIYVMMQLPSLYAYGSFVVQGEQPVKKEVGKLLEAGFKKDGSWPSYLTLPKGDPAEKLFREVAEPHGVKIDVRPSSELEPYAAPFKAGFAKQAYSPAGMLSLEEDELDNDDLESARAGIPDSYDPCPCASGKKYKFCCKRTFREVIMAMTDAEDGHYKEALKWMAKAEAINGPNGEVLCRYGIVYSHFDQEKADEYLEKCQRLFPKYPRVHYLRGIEHKEKGEREAALAAYRRAIELYLPTDRYHLNEVWNNVGTIQYELRRYEEAKAAWEKALVYLPSDRVTKKNLIEFIYANPAIPDELRRPSQFVERFMAARIGNEGNRNGE
ncbi:MAG: tetratricopeptide repeat protein [Deltaproteobacteria bacterium]|nr:tetratricopeptide repeat protein [Deltaproteobacteria bacterium]